MASPSLERGLGCALILPAMIIGLVGLTDYVGPTGWRGFAEVIGWESTCIIAAWAVARALSAMRDAGRRYIVFVLPLVLLIGSFTYLIHWLGLGAPMSAKLLFTTLLQFTGAATVCVAVGWLGYIVWVGRRQS